MNCNLYILILIIFFILVYFRSNEHFDQRVDNATKEQCGIMCTKVLGCKAFSYDAKNKYCYLSKDDIYYQPEKKAYVQFYNTKFPRCNKIYGINDPYYNTHSNIVRNAIYGCMAEENGKVQYKIYDNKEREIKELRDINDIKNQPLEYVNNVINNQKIDPYTFINIKWTGSVPISDGRFNTALEVIAPTDDIDADNKGPIIKTPDLIDKYTTHIIYDQTPDVSTKENGTINLNEHPEYALNPTKSNSINTMKEYDDEFLGQYMFPQKCITDISKDKCMKICLDADNCVGVDWNPILFDKVGDPNKYKFNENVCCPKIKINKVIPRSENARHGHFYLKQNLMNEQINNNGEDKPILVGLNKELRGNQIYEDSSKTKNPKKRFDLSEKLASWSQYKY